MSELEHTEEINPEKLEPGDAIVVPGDGTLEYWEVANTQPMKLMRYEKEALQSLRPEAEALLVSFVYPDTQPLIVPLDQTIRILKRSVKGEGQ